MAVEVRAATPEDYAAIYGRPRDSGVLTVDGRIAAIGSLVERPDGRLFANLDVASADLLAPHGRTAVLVMRRVLALAPRPVFAGCWEVRYPQAPKLFALLGFRPTDEIADNGNRVWVLEDEAR